MAAQALHQRLDSKIGLLQPLSKHLIYWALIYKFICDGNIWIICNEYIHHYRIIKFNKI